MQKDYDRINKKKQELEKKKDTLSQSAIEKEVQSIIQEEGAVFGRQQELENMIREKFAQIGNEIKSIINDAITMYYDSKDNSYHIVIPIEFDGNPLYDISDEIVKIANDAYQNKSKGKSKKTTSAKATTEKADSSKTKSTEKNDTKKTSKDAVKLK